ncbi:MAG: hypothetical protein GY865_04785 [candidate division Zixibacteria bacterium]|nr:hypothetical protein [candidate division Zixibacteria bacterium]
MNDQKNANVSFKDFEWLAGSWEGEAFGGNFEEVWSPATAGSMCGTFKLFSNNKVSFYEIFTITIDSTGPVLRLKHFNADLTGWEEKDEVISFPYIDCNKNELQFDGLIYRKISDEAMRIVLRTRDANGIVTDNIIDCKRSNN